MGNKNTDLEKLMRHSHNAIAGWAPSNEPIHMNYVLFLACTAAMGGLLFGFDIGIITGAGPYITRAFELSDLGLGWAFSSLLFGCVLGCILVGKLVDRYGRKRLLVFVAILFTITSVATAIANNFTVFDVARFLGGVAVGGVSLLSPMYISEVSPASVRGRMGTLYQMSIVCGVIISYGLNYLLRNSGTNNWRWMFLTGVLPSAIFLVSITVAPESPRFLVMVGRESEAFATLERIRGPESASFEIQQITATAPSERQAWRSLLRPGVRRALAVGACLGILIQLSGINTIIDYAPPIFQSAGWKIDSALASTIVVGATELLFTIMSLWFIDRLGRKPVYIVGSFGMMLSLLLLIVAVVVGRFHGPFVLASILMYLAFFAACIGPVFWTLVPEIFPNDVRGKAMMVPVLVQWIANALVVLFFPYAFHVIGKAATFSFLALMAMVQGLFTWLFVPETKNVSLEDIETQWTASNEFSA